MLKILKTIMSISISEVILRSSQGNARLPEVTWVKVHMSAGCLDCYLYTWVPVVSIHFKYLTKIYILPVGN